MAVDAKRTDLYGFSKSSKGSLAERDASLTREYGEDSPVLLANLVVAKRPLMQAAGRGSS